MLELDFAFIGKIAPDTMQRASTVALWGDGGFLPQFEYDLTGTPCAEVVQKKPCCYPDAVDEAFPEGEWLQRNRLRSYAGMPLLNSNGQVMGLISVKGRDPPRYAGLAESMLRIFATRAAGELERMQAQDGLNRYSERLRTLSQRLLASQETERRRVARELHDRVRQAAATANFSP